MTDSQLATITIYSAADTDNDKMPDEWETNNFNTLERDGTGDFDGDGISDLDEYLNEAGVPLVASAYELTIKADPAGSGVITPAEGIYNYPEEERVTVEAKANPGYKFDHWTGDVADTASATTTVTMNSAKTVTAHFVQGIANYNLTIKAEPEDGGITIPASGVYSYAEGTVVNIEAIAGSGYGFEHWTGNVADASSVKTSVIMNSEQTVIALFTALEHLKGDADGNGEVDIFDALTIAEYDAGLWNDRLELLPADFEIVADIDGNGVINTYDALEVARYDAGLESLFD